MQTILASLITGLEELYCLRADTSRFQYIFEDSDEDITLVAEMARIDDDANPLREKLSAEAFVQVKKQMERCCRTCI